MAGLVIVFTTVIAALFPRCGLAEIQLSPSNLRLDGAETGRVDVTCRLPAGNTSSVSVIRISRNTAAQPGVDQGLAAANILNFAGKAVLSSGGLSETMATVSGSTSEKSVTLTMAQADCQYAGVYHCSITYITGTVDNPVPGVLNDTQNLTVTVPPSNLATFVAPDNPSYTANDTVELFCNAAIGNYQQGKEPEPVWIWEYYDIQNTTWRQYTEKGDIRTETPVLVRNCVYRQICYLTLILSTEDSQRQYRCTVTKNGEQASAVITLGIVHSGVAIPPTAVTTAGTTTTNTGGDDTCTCTCTCRSKCPSP